MLRLVRRGLLNIAREQAAVTEVWRSAVDDMLALGYGLRREVEADAQAFEAVMRLGFDPDSAMRWLARLADQSLVFKVHRPWELDRMHEVYDTICSHSRCLQRPAA